MTTPPVVCPDAPASDHTSFTHSVLSLMRALLAARDPGVDATPRLPQARLGEAATVSYDSIPTPHVRVDM